MGCKDYLRNLTKPLLTPLEQCTVNSLVERFVQGFFRPDLKQEAIDKGIFNCFGLWLAYDTVRIYLRLLE
jgi:hypothetical protein